MYYLQNTYTTMQFQPSPLVQQQQQQQHQPLTAKKPKTTRNDVLRRESDSSEGFSDADNVETLDAGVANGTAHKLSFPYTFGSFLPPPPPLLTDDVLYRAMINDENNYLFIPKNFSHFENEMNAYPRKRWLALDWMRDMCSQMCTQRGTFFLAVFYFDRLMHSGKHALGNNADGVHYAFLCICMASMMRESSQIDYFRIHPILQEENPNWLLHRAVERERDLFSMPQQPFVAPLSGENDGGDFDAHMSTTTSSAGKTNALSNDDNRQVPPTKSLTLQSEGADARVRRAHKLERLFLAECAHLMRDMDWCANVPLVYDFVVLYYERLLAKHQEESRGANGKRFGNGFGGDGGGAPHHGRNSSISKRTSVSVKSEEERERESARNFRRALCGEGVLREWEAANPESETGRFHSEIGEDFRRIMTFVEYVTMNSDSVYIRPHHLACACIYVLVECGELRLTLSSIDPSTVMRVCKCAGIEDADRLVFLACKMVRDMLPVPSSVTFRPDPNREKLESAGWTVWKSRLHQSLRLQPYTADLEKCRYYTEVIRPRTGFRVFHPDVLEIVQEQFATTVCDSDAVEMCLGSSSSQPVQIFPESSYYTPPVRPSNSPAY